VTRIGQTYITGAGRMGYADWQIIMRGSWAYDYAYAVTSALTVADRRAWESDLLQFYLDRLQDAGGRPPAFEAAFLAYRRNAIYGYFVGSRPSPVPPRARHRIFSHVRFRSTSSIAPQTPSTISNHSRPLRANTNRAVLAKAWVRDQCPCRSQMVRRKIGSPRRG
jgi:hypothetical protein